MTREKIVKKILVMTSMMSFGVITAHAAGTNFGTDIDNSVTLNYQVGGVAQTSVVSNTDTFKVDRKVDILVATTDGTNVIVVPGDNIAPQDNNKPLTFTVTNSSNGAQSYTLSASNLANGSNTLDAGETDNIDFATDLKICTDATCTGGDISGTEIVFAEDATKTYYVFADIPSSTADGSRASVALSATAVNTGTTTAMTDDSADADDAAVVQVVFAEGSGDAAGDGANDGKHSALSAYEVATATVSAAKSSCVVSDPVNGTTNPKRIPGATVRYAIDIDNAGSADATSVSVADALQSDLVYTSGEIRNAACNCAAPAGSVIAGDTVSAAGQNVTADFGTVSASAHECAYIEVEIN